MSHMLIINANIEETRVAFVEGGMLSELFMERIKDRGILGNIYKGVVSRVIPSMQAAFVDIGIGKAAFLHVSDIQHRGNNAFNLFSGPEELEFKDQVLNEDEEEHFKKEKKQEDYKMPDICDLVKEGQAIMVQIAKEPLSTKGPRVTSRLSMPGRHLVYMPTIDHIGISRRIEDEQERSRLRDIVEEIRPKGSGFIVRTAAKGKSKYKLQVDMEFLINLWNDILGRHDSVKAPDILHEDLNLILRATRDLFTTDIDKLVVDSRVEFKKINDFIKFYLPKLKSKVELYQGEEPIFDAYGIEMEISRALERQVWLKSGGSIVIDQTEALTAIDVNTGRHVSKENTEDTFTMTNLEAVREIVYQLRLRNLGGIIIIDFIDMQKQSNRDKVYHHLIEQLKLDRAKTKVQKISELGLVEMTRKRIRESLGRFLGELCPYCDGKGFIKSCTTVCYEVFREIRRVAINLPGSLIEVNTNSEIADMLFNEEHENLDHLEKKYNKKISVRSFPSFHREDFEITGK